VRYLNPYTWYVAYMTFTKVAKFLFICIIEGVKLFRRKDK